ncbi:Glyoxalase/Bleomycin resistance protein/Dihydroxybiphenyl dioxygenase [Microthyrium microscopicum]|uniref:Glyoxalase/Bleomycin resistance protein/Dihydroxybiphenyl dioxygenase n=1 Tax=Microthyrium microscopicum TaxID=703497 RepID=A0A6A6U1D6_9PEZI|nr:Glyoxalase/Bleomycin resistance protein/Dihydroxybiphenyl dioxygenase [Microthyrium microscopicum]
MLSFKALLLLVPTAMAARFGAVGVAVSDMAKSQAFYEKSLGLKAAGQVLVTSEFNETIMTIPGSGTGPALVLMKYKSPKTTTDLPVKLVFYVDDMTATMSKMKEAGARVINEPGSLKIRNVTLPTAFVKDPDGYSVELNPMSAFGKLP